MIRIATICLLISIVRSQECSLNEAEIEKLQNAFSGAINYFKNQDKNETAIIFMGNARAGKSTLINYLMGNKLKAVKLSRVSKITIEKADKTTAGPEIGAGVLSATEIPSGWKSRYFPNATIWDSPGFSDNRGPVTDISNAFYLYELLKNVNAMKIVIVIDYADIRDDNIQSFFNLLIIVENVLGNSFKNIFSGTSIILSKASFNEDEFPVDSDYITSLFREQILNNPGLDMSQTSREFIKYIVDHSNRIGFFRRAKRAGDISSDIDDNIVQAINSSTLIGKELIHSLKPSISQMSTLCLYSARKKLLSDPKFGELQKAVIDVFTEQIKIVKSTNLDHSSSTVNGIQNNLTAIKAKLTDFDKTNFSAYEGIEMLGTIDRGVNNTIQRNGVLKTVELIGFVNSLLQSEINKELVLTVKSIIKTALIKIDEAFAVIEFKTRQIDEEEYKKKIELIKEEGQSTLENMEHALETEKNKTKGNGFWKDLWDSILDFFKSIGRAVLSTIGLD